MDLNIRNIDETLVTKLKHEALDTGVTLRELVIGKLGGEAGPEVDEDVKSGKDGEGMPF